MDRNILTQKLMHAFSDALRTRERTAAKKAITLTRMDALRAIDDYIAISGMANSFSRRIRKREAQLPKRDIQVTVLNPYTGYVRKARERLEILGEMMFRTLDVWQQAGGTFQELCNLCNISEEHGKKAIGRADRTDFPGFIFVHTLDYKDPDDWIEYTTNAPMTVCLKEFMLKQMLNTKSGQRAAHEAIEKAFPELMDRAIHRVEDREGNTHYIDNDGVEFTRIDTND